MSKLIPLFLLCCLANVSADVFYVGQVGTLAGEQKGYTREKLIELFEAYNAFIPTIRSKLRNISGEVESIKPDGYILKGNQRYFYITGAREMQVGDRFVGKGVAESLLVEETESGKETNMYKYSVYPIQYMKVLTQDEFLDALKSGEKFSITVTNEISCDECFGDGQTRGRPEVDIRQKADQQYKCRKCDGTGKAKIKSEYLVAWMP